MILPWCGSCHSVFLSRAEHVCTMAAIEVRLGPAVCFGCVRHRSFRIADVAGSAATALSLPILSAVWASVPEFLEEAELALHRRVGGTARTSSTCCRTCSSCAVFRGTYGPTTGRSSSRRPIRTELRRCAPRPPRSPRAVLGRMATSRDFTPGSVTSCSTERSSTRYAKPRSSSRAGGNATIPCAGTRRLAIERRHQKCSCPASLRPPCAS